ncbi:MAG: threonine synthase, partial [Acutalibacteraceae bacterium]|nr:threonine synthase [Acutalibacteraceae bacterium]
MDFTSTRSKQSITSAQAITKGLSSDGGLFVPGSFPKISDSEIDKLISLDYKGRAVQVLKKYLTDFTDDEINYCVNGAYDNTFDDNIPAPLKEIAPGENILELWHGPTCAFKDMALQLLPYLLTTSAKKAAKGKTMVILVATSGDTGKAALDGFADVPDTKIIVFYPEDGVSPMQKLQMTTQSGNNVAVCAIKGNFDDAQTGVKKIFGDKEMAEYLAERNMEFSSANSINFGRLVPQVVYYVSSYCELVKSGKINKGDTFNVAVPTGNFGNILAAYYAKQMGIPIGKLICASNKNNVLTDFLKTGRYNKNREFYTTSSPSMDIL